jgi:hypothetical protein
VNATPFCDKEINPLLSHPNNDIQQEIEMKQLAQNKYIDIFLMFPNHSNQTRSWNSNITINARSCIYNYKQAYLNPVTICRHTLALSTAHNGPILGIRHPSPP